MKHKLLFVLLSFCVANVALAAGVLNVSGGSQAAECELIAPVLVYRRLSTITGNNHICYTDGSEYFQYIARDVNSNVEIEIGFEDNFDGTWYGYVFEYDSGAVNALSDVYRYDLTPEQVNSCRIAFEPSFGCIGQ